MTEEEEKKNIGGTNAAIGWTITDIRGISHTFACTKS